MGSQISINFKKDQDTTMGEWRNTLRVFCAETWLKVYRTIAIRKQWLSRADLGPHKKVSQWKNVSSHQGSDGSSCKENSMDRLLKISMM